MSYTVLGMNIYVVGKFSSWIECHYLKMKQVSFQFVIEKER